MKTNITFLCFALVLAFQVKASTDKYRLTWREDPSTTMVIGWNQISGTNPVVHYGPTDQGINWASYPSSKAPDKSIAYKGMNNRFVRLTGLLPDKAYYFVIRDSEGTSVRIWFKTAPADPNTRLSIIAGGDSRNNAIPRRNANKLVAKLRPHAILFGGDMTDTGTNDQWIEWFNDWQLTRSTDGRMYPVIAARGNHESSNSDIIELFDAPGTGVYYALNLGGTLLRAYTLNTETTISGNQTTWLQNDLTANNQVTWKMAQYHKPIRPHNSGKVEGTNQYTYWTPLFQQYKMNLVVECDAHTVKTTWPIRPFTGTGSVEGFIRDDQNGTVYVGEGCWGAPLRANDDNKSWTRNSGMFNQFNWIFIDQDKIETRKVVVDNADQVGALTDANLFTMPSNINVWNPSNGGVVTINKPSSNTAPQVAITAPATGQQYASPQSITISASASDAGGSIAKVEFFVNGALVSTDLTSPYSTSYAIPAQGSYTLTARAFDNLNASTTSAGVAITCGTVSQTVQVRIATGMDDVEQHSNGSVYTNSSDIELVNDGPTVGDQTIGLRFNGLNIPQGATINRAYIRFTTDEVTTAACTVTIRGEASNNAGAFTTSTNNVSNRTKTTASVNWTPSGWATVGESSTAQTTPELKAIVQEIVNRSGFSASSSMAFIITGTGKRTAEAYEGSASQAPLLYIEYTVGEAAPVPPPVVFDYAVNSRVSAGANDAEEAESGTMYLTSSDLELVYDAHLSSGNQQVGLRFLNLNIPKNATITSAYVQFTCDEVTTGATSLRIYGQAADNAEVFTSTAYDISARSKTNSYSDWTPAAWSTVGEASTVQRTSDLSSIIQEIVNRSGYASSSAIALIMTGTGSRIAEAYEGSASQAPILYVAYTSSSAREAASLVDVQDTDTWMSEGNRGTVFPNPFNETLSLDMHREGNVKLELVNSFGVLVWTENTYDLVGRYELKSIAKLPAGLYFLNIHSETGVETYTVVKK